MFRKKQPKPVPVPIDESLLSVEFNRKGKYQSVRFPPIATDAKRRQGHAVVPMCFLHRDPVKGHVLCWWPVTTEDLSSAEDRMRKCWSPLVTYEAFPIDTRHTKEFTNYKEVSML